MRILHTELGTITRAALHPERQTRKTAKFLGNAVVSVDGREYAFSRVVYSNTGLAIDNGVTIKPLYNSPVTIYLLSGGRPPMTFQAVDFLADIREYDELFVDDIESPSETMRQAAILFDTLLLG